MFWGVMAVGAATMVRDGAVEEHLRAKHIKKRKDHLKRGNMEARHEKAAEGS